MLKINGTAKVVALFSILGVFVLSFQNCGPTEVKLDGGLQTTSSVGVSSGTSDQVKDIFNTVFGRLPTTTEMTQYSNLLNSGTSASTLRTQLAGSSESQANITALVSQYVSPSLAAAATPYYQTLLGSSMSLSQINSLLQSKK